MPEQWRDLANDIQQLFKHRHAITLFEGVCVTHVIVAPGACGRAVPRAFPETFQRSNAANASEL